MSPEQQDQTGETKAERWPIGRRIVGRIRGELNESLGPFRGEEDEDVFETLYLMERDVCVPEHLIGDDLLCDIRNMYYYVFDGVREELVEKSGTRPHIFTIIDPTYDDSTWALLISGNRVLLNVSRKAWHFHWQNEDEMAEELEEWYREAADGLGLLTTPEAGPIGEQLRFRVTLFTERVLHVVDDEANRALEQALAWRSNEESLDVQLWFERLVESRVISLGPERDGKRQDVGEAGDGDG